MELQLSNGRTIRDPGISQIRAGLAAAGSANGFVIIRRNEMTYIQAAGDRENGFYLEYQTGSLEKHYKSRRSDVPFETTLAIFLAFHEMDRKWWHLAEWEKDTIRAAVGRHKEVASLVGLLFMLGMFVILAQNSHDAETWFISQGLSVFEVFVYTLTIAFGLGFPWARQYIKKEPEMKDRTWVWAQMTYYAAPVFTGLSVLILLSHVVR